MISNHTNIYSDHHLQEQPQQSKDLNVFPKMSQNNQGISYIQQQQQQKRPQQFIENSLQPSLPSPPQQPNLYDYSYGADLIYPFQLTQNPRFYEQIPKEPCGNNYISARDNVQQFLQQQQQIKQQYEQLQTKQYYYQQHQHTEEFSKNNHLLTEQQVNNYKPSISNINYQPTAAVANIKQQQFQQKVSCSLTNSPKHSILFKPIESARPSFISYSNCNHCITQPSQSNHPIINYNHQTNPTQKSFIPAEFTWRQNNDNTCLNSQQQQQLLNKHRYLKTDYSNFIPLYQPHGHTTQTIPMDTVTSTAVGVGATSGTCFGELLQSSSSVCNYSDYQDESDTRVRTTIPTEFIQPNCLLSINMNQKNVQPTSKAITFQNNKYTQPRSISLDKQQSLLSPSTTIPSPWVIKNIKTNHCFFNQRESKSQYIGSKTKTEYTAQDKYYLTPNYLNNQQLLVNPQQLLPSIKPLCRTHKDNNLIHECNKMPQEEKNSIQYDYKYRNSGGHDKQPQVLLTQQHARQYIDQQQQPQLPLLATTTNNTVSQVNHSQGQHDNSSITSNIPSFSLLPKVQGTFNDSVINTQQPQQSQRYQDFHLPSNSQSISPLQRNNLGYMTFPTTVSKPFINSFDDTYLKQILHPLTVEILQQLKIQERNNTKEQSQKQQYLDNMHNKEIITTDLQQKQFNSKPPEIEEIVLSQPNNYNKKDNTKIDITYKPSYFNKRDNTQQKIQTINNMNQMNKQGQLSSFIDNHNQNRELDVSKEVLSKGECKSHSFAGDFNESNSSKHIRKTSNTLAQHIPSSLEFKTARFISSSRQHYNNTISEQKDKQSKLKRIKQQQKSNNHPHINSNTFSAASCTFSSQSISSSPLEFSPINAHRDNINSQKQHFKTNNKPLLRSLTSTFKSPSTENILNKSSLFVLSERNQRSQTQSFKEQIYSQKLNYISNDDDNNNLREKQHRSRISTSLLKQIQSLSLQIKNLRKCDEATTSSSKDNWDFKNTQNNRQCEQNIIHFNSQQSSSREVEQHRKQMNREAPMAQLPHSSVMSIKKHQKYIKNINNNFQSSLTNRCQTESIQKQKFIQQQQQEESQKNQGRTQDICSLNYLNSMPEKTLINITSYGNLEEDSLCQTKPTQQQQEQ